MCGKSDYKERATYNRKDFNQFTFKQDLTIRSLNNPLKPELTVFLPIKHDPLNQHVCRKKMYLQTPGVLSNQP